MRYMKRGGIIAVATLAVLAGIALYGCSDDTDYETLREISWEGTELTISLGTNKSTGCVWDTKSQDDRIIDYSINRVFHLSDERAKKGEAAGVLDAGFKGKAAGTTKIVCTTPVSWDGSGEGYTYIVTVTVDEDGNIVEASGEEK